MIGIFLEALVHDRFEIATALGIHPPESLRFIALDAFHQFRRRRLLGRAKEWPKRQQFPERRTETVDIRSTIERADGHHLLRAGVAERADKLPRAREPAFGVVGQLRESEIHEHGLFAVGSDKHIARLDVAVQHAGLV